MGIEAADKFFARARRIHGFQYDYSNTVYRGFGHKLKIVCPLHGEFEQFPSNHYRHGCPSCGRIKAGLANQITAGDFIEKSRLQHGDRYDYSQVRYEGNKRRVTISCPVHGAFQQTPNAHMLGRGCDRCGGTATNTREDFRRKAEKVHGDRYDYSSVQCGGNAGKVLILCREHGAFEQQAGNHLSGHGCPACAAAESSTRLLATAESFIQKSKAVHGSKYGYGNVEYLGSQVKVAITCPKHGDFFQKPGDHVNDANGCPSCRNHYSSFHKTGEAYLQDLGVSFESNVRGVIPPVELDTYIPSHHLAIEFNGTFWHSITEASSGRLRHKSKFDRCAAAGINLLQIEEQEWNNPAQQEIWKSILASRLGKHETRIQARRTRFEVIGKQTATYFLAEHHLQGAPPLMKWCFGLFHAEELVGVVIFSEHEKDRLNLTRLAFPSFVTVVGGAQKLFKNALPHLPPRDIVTFSDNRYSSGAIYPVLGFQHDIALPPSYEWFYRNTLMNKRQCRHKYLPKLLGDQYDPALTEHGNMFRAGARILYDAGYQRWLYRRRGD